MGILKVHHQDDSVFSYLFFKCNEDEKEIILYILDYDQRYFSLKLDTENEYIQSWANTLHQEPSDYISNLLAALEELHKSGISKSDCIEDEVQNVFEIDNTSNLMWKQVIKFNNITGKKGKFPLKEEPKDSKTFNLILELISKKSSEDFRDLCKLQKTNSSLTKENDELRGIAERSVEMKEEFENEIYAKFALLLNSKKAKIVELNEEIKRLKGETSEPRPSTSKGGEESPVLVESESDYETDTDLDTPEKARDSEEEDEYEDTDDESLCSDSDLLARTEKRRFGSAYNDESFSTQVHKKAKPSLEQEDSSDVEIIYQSNPAEEMDTTSNTSDTAGNETFHSEALSEAVLEDEASDSKVLGDEDLLEESIEDEAIEGELLATQALESEALEADASENEALEDGVVEAQSLEAEASESGIVEAQLLENEALNDELLQSEALDKESLEAGALDGDAVISEALENELLNDSLESELKVGLRKT